jgi:peroxiredoxin (alkyl hydroperoxide reductase subunit C)
MSETETQHSAIPVGGKAPDFTLKDQSGADVSLADFRGKKHVVLVFYPASFTSICAVQMPGYNQTEQRWEDQAAQVLGISVDSVAVHKAFAEYIGGVDFPLLADFFPHGAVAKAYGVLRPNGTAERSTFVVDKTGIVRYAEVHPMGSVPDRAPAIEVLRALNA